MAAQIFPRELILQFGSGSQQAGSDVWRRRWWILGGVVLALAVTAVTLSFRRPRIYPTPETTYLTTPLRSDGAVDYATAINQRFSEGVTPESNAAVILLQILGPRPTSYSSELNVEFYKQLGMERPSPGGIYFVEFAEFLKHRKGLNSKSSEFQTALQDYETAQNRPWQPEEFPLLDDWLTLIDAPLSLIPEAVQRPRHFAPLIVEPDEHGPFPPITFTSLNYLEGYRHLGRALVCRAMLRLGKGHDAAAWNDLLHCARLGCLTSGPGCNMHYLTGLHIELQAWEGMHAYLNHARLKDIPLQQIQRDLDNLPDVEQAVSRMLFCERCNLLDLFQFLSRGEALEIDEDLLGLDRGDFVLWTIWGPSDWRPAMRFANRYYDQAEDLFALPSYQLRRSALVKLRNDIQTAAKSDVHWVLLGFRSENLVTALFMPLLEGTNKSTTQRDQLRINLRTAIALQAWRAAQGRYPDSLAELTPQYLAEVPVDLFVEKPLNYQKKEAGCRIYSVGPDLVSQDGAEDDLAISLSGSPD